MARIARGIGAVAGLLVLAGVVASIAWALIGIGVRPLDGVEGEILFEADRMRSGLTLYVDPMTGAYDYGAVPARYLVLYPPVWSWIVSHVPRAYAEATTRIVAIAAWLGVLWWIARRAPAARSKAAIAGAAFVASSFALMLYGASGRPDAIAVSAAGLALERTARKSSEAGEARIDAIAGALFALAAWLKPNVVGIEPGAFVAAAVIGWSRTKSLRGIVPGLLGAFATTGIIAGILTSTTGTTWIDHLLASTGQEPSLGHWIDQLASRGPFFALPLGAAIVIGWRGRRDPGAAIATGALVTSVAWCVLSLAKIGSASNYLMEPCVAAVVVLARADLPKLSPRGLVIASLVILGQVAWDDVASVTSALERVPREREARAAIGRARQACNASDTDVVIADEPGLELMANGRIVQTPFQSTHLARKGRFSIPAWIDDVSRPEATSLLMQDDLLDRPLSEINLEHDRFPVAIRAVLRERFVEIGRSGGIVTYCRRTAPSP